MGGSCTVDPSMPTADSELVSMVEGSVSWSDESAGELNSSDSRISVDRIDNELSA